MQNYLVFIIWQNICRNFTKMFPRICDKMLKKIRRVADPLVKRSFPKIGDIKARTKFNTKK